MFSFISTDITTSGILDFLMPMTATCGEFIRKDELCKVSVIHTRNGMIMGLVHSSGNTFTLDDHERGLVEKFYTQS